MKNKKQNLLWIAIILLMTSTFFPAVFAQSTDSNYLEDINNHWAQNEIISYVEKGFFKGYNDHTFKPDVFIKRSEFVTVINKVFGFYEKEFIDFKDVSKGSWYYDEILKAKYIGYVNGDNQGYFYPDQYITRQEAATIIARIHDLDEDTIEEELNFSDKNDISDWAVDNVKAVVQKGYIKGYRDNTFKSKNNITRAEAAVLISRVSGEVYNAKGDYGKNEAVKTIQGNVTVACTGVNLSNLHIKGDLYLTEGIGDGEVRLDNVKVDGKTIIKGGGPNSILIINSDLNIVVINTETGQVRVLAKDDTKIDNVVVSSSAKLEEEELTGDGFRNCIVNVPDGEEVIFAGEFKNVEIDSPNMNLNVASGNIENLTISDKAKNTNLEIGKNVTIGNANIKAAAKITGEGKIEKADIESDDVDIDEDVYSEPSSSGSNSGSGSRRNSTPSNTAPIVVNEIADITDAIVGKVITVDLSNVFTDDDGDVLTLSADKGIIEDKIWKRTPSAIETITVTITANDENGGTASDSFNVTSIDPNSISTVKPGEETQTGTAVPASNDGETAAVPYMEDVSQWFVDSNTDIFTYTLVSVQDSDTNDVSSDVTLNRTTGAIFYTPEAAQAGKYVSINVKGDNLTDGTIGNVIITITVGAVPSDGNSAPIVENPIPDQSGTVGEAFSYTFGADVFADADGDNLTYTAAPLPNGITFTAGTRTFSGTPTTAGTTSVVVAADDSKGGTVTETFDIVITEVPNSAPAANACLITTDEDTPISGILAANDADNDDLTFSKVSDPYHGSVTINADGSYTYTPTTNYNGFDSFTFKADDGAIESESATVSITINSINDVPTLESAIPDQSETVGEAFSYTFGADVFADADGDNLTYTAAPLPNGITFTAGTRTFSGTPTTAGTTSVVVAADDSKGGTVTETFDIVITEVPNSAPAANACLITTDEDTPISGILAANDADNDDLTFSKVSDPYHGSVTINADGSYTYTPTTNYNGFDSFTFKVGDGTIESEPATVSITVNPVNDAPTVVSGEEIQTGTAIPESNDTFTSAVLYTANVSGWFDDIDEDTLTYELVSAQDEGTTDVSGDVSLDTNTGALSYTPDAAQVEQDVTIEVKANDTTADSASNVTITVAVGAVPNSDPVAEDDTGTVDEDSTILIDVLANDSDEDGDTLAIDSFTEASDGTIAQEGDSIRYTPDEDFNETDSFTYTIRDGNGGTDTGTVNITINSINDLPVAVDDTPTTNEDTAVTVTVLANDTDVDGDTLSVTGFTQGIDGSVSQEQETNNLIYTPNLNFNGADSFTYDISDGKGGIATATVNVTITPINDVPTVISGEEIQTGTATPASNDTLTPAVSYSTDVSGWFDDVEEDTLTYELVSAQDEGTTDVGGDVSLDTNTGALSYTPDAAQAEQDITIEVKANDTTADSASNVTITVEVGAVPADTPLTAEGTICDSEAGIDFIGVLYTRDGNIYYNQHDGQGNWAGEILISAGTEGKLAVDNLDCIHAAYTTAGDKIGYRMYDGSAWTDEELIESNNGGACSMPDIDTDSSGFVHITYTDTLGNTGDAWDYPDIMYATNSSGSFQKSLIFNGYKDNYDNMIPGYPAQYFEKGSNIAVKEGNYYITAHKYGTGYSKTYSVEVKSNLGSGSTGTSSSNVFDIYDLTANGGKVIALYKHSSFKTAELSVSGETINFTNTEDLTGASVSSVATNGTDIVAAGISSTKLQVHYNGISSVFDDIAVEGTKVSVVNLDGNFYAVYRDNSDHKIKMQLIGAPALTYTISLDTIDPTDLGTVTEGYASEAPTDVSVIKTGTGDITNLLVALSGTNADSFTVTQPVAATLDDETTSTTFTVVPNDGLAVGTYTANVDVTANDGVSESFIINFIVKEPAPAESALMPTADATDVLIDAVVSIVFDRNVTVNNLSGIKIEYDDGGIQSVPSLSSSLNDRTITIDHDDFLNGTTFTVTVPADAVRNSEGTGNEEITWSFTTVILGAEITIDSLPLQIGANETATASTTEAGAWGWISEMPSVATIDAEGNITALTQGSTIISYTTSTSGKVNSVEVEVYSEPNDVSGSLMFGDSTTTISGGTKQLTGFSSPNPDETGTFEIKDGSTDVITVDNNGLVTYVADDTKTIRYELIETETGQLYEFGEVDITAGPAPAPTLLSTFPGDQDNNIPTTGDLTVVFNENIAQAGDNLNGVTITCNGGDDSVGNISISIDTDDLRVLNIAHDELANGTYYTVSIPSGLVKQEAERSYTNEEITFSFTTVAKEITGFTALTDVTLDADEHLIDLAALKASGKLPDTVEVTDGTTPVNATITDWSGTFDGTVTDTYTLTATWTMPDGYADEIDPIAVTLNVVVSTAQTEVPAPIISDVEIKAGDYNKIGGTIIATVITDDSGYTADEVFVNGVDVTDTIEDQGDNTYKFTYTVAEGDTDRSAEEDIPISVVLNNNGMTNDPYTEIPTYTLSLIPLIDANKPTVVSASVEYAAPDKIVIVFSETINGNTQYQLNTFTINESSSPVSMTALPSDTVTFTLDAPVSSGEEVTFTYTGEGDFADTPASNQLEGFTVSVENNVIQ